MGFVYGNETHFHVLKLGFEDVGKQSFGRHIKELYTTKDAIFERCDYLAPAHSRIDGGRLYAFLPQMVNLVFHQGYQRGYHHANPRHHQGWHLEGDRLSTARGHQSKRILSLGDTLDDVSLNATKIGVAPILAQRSFKRIVGGLHAVSFFHRRS